MCLFNFFNWYFVFLDPAVLKRKRQKYGGESSPQNILRQPQDDDSSEYFEIMVKGFFREFLECIWRVGLWPDRVAGGKTL